MPTQGQTPADLLDSVHELNAVLDCERFIVFQGIGGKEAAVHDVLRNLQDRQRLSSLMIPTPKGECRAGPEPNGAIEPLRRIDLEARLRLETRRHLDVIVQPMLPCTHDGMANDPFDLLPFIGEQTAFYRRVIASVQANFPTGLIYCPHHLLDRHGGITVANKIVELVLTVIWMPMEEAGRKEEKRGLETKGVFEFQPLLEISKRARTVPAELPQPFAQEHSCPPGLRPPP